MADQGSPTRTLRLTPTPGAHPDSDDQLSTELDAIITIGRALSHIPDAETRTRVMRWAIERFGIDVTPPPEPGSDLKLPSDIMPTQPSPEAAAETLNLDGIADLFPAADESAETDELQFALSRSRDRKRVSSKTGDRLRDALHWMGI